MKHGSASVNGEAGGWMDAWVVDGKVLSAESPGFERDEAKREHETGTVEGQSGTCVSCPDCRAAWEGRNRGWWGGGGGFHWVWLWKEQAVCVCSELQSPGRGTLLKARNEP